jgi:TRAP-type C4-dicarboxylate transport system permease small subunit
MELILVSFIVMLFWTNTFSVPLKRHVAFTVVRDAVPPQLRRVFGLLSSAACVAVLAAALPAVIGMAAYEVRESTPILHVPLAVNYGFFALFTAAYIVRLVLWVVGLLRPGWRDRV